MKSKIKIAFILDNYLVPKWQYNIVDNIINSDNSLVSLIILNDTDALKKNFPRIYSNFSLIKLYQTIDKSLFGGKNNYSQDCSLVGLIQNIQTIHAKNDVSLRSIKYSIDTCESIKESEPDVILKLGYGIPTGDILKIPKFGLWAFTLDNFGTDAFHYSFNVSYNKPSVAYCDLVVMKGEKAKPELISRTVENLCSYSVHITREKLFMRASLVPSRILDAMSTIGDGCIESLKQKYWSCEDAFHQNPQQFSFRKQVDFIFRISFQGIKKIFKKIFFTDPFDWILLFNSEEEVFKSNHFGNFLKIRSSKDKFWADPFIIKRSSKYYVFVEEFVYKKNKGHISVIELDRKGMIANIKVIIEKDYHMSYPFVFESDGVLYMIPESSENRTVDVYKCNDFPGQWDYQKTIMKDISAFDTTLFLFNGKWWMFTLKNELKGSKDESPELFLYYSDSFLSDNWISHPLNPIVSDIRTARPAGRIFIKDGKIIRPSQDCSVRYGRAINYNVIITLSENEYFETLSERVEPDWDKSLKGIHTLNSDGGSIIIDAYSFRLRRPLSFLSKITNKM